MKKQTHGLTHPCKVKDGKYFSRYKQLAEFILHQIVLSVSEYRAIFVFHAAGADILL